VVHWQEVTLGSQAADASATVAAITGGIISLYMYFGLYFRVLNLISALQARL